MSSNIIVGNGCGVFSAFLNFFSWMAVSDLNDIDVSLHVCNKTHDWNNCLTTPENPYIRSTQFDRTLLEKNVLSEIFAPGDYIKTEYPEQFTFLEHYPDLFYHCIKNYPGDVLKYSGKGGMTQVYQDTAHLELNRKSFNDQWNKLSYTEKFQERVDEEEKLIEGKKVLSVMLRTIYHYVDRSTGQVASEDAAPSFIRGAITNIRERMSDYDAVLLTTQNQPYIDAFVKEFGEDCIFTDRPRFEDFNDWRGVGKDTYELSDEKYQQEVEECLLDVILTSKSDHILGTCSNMFLGALSMNTENTCELIQEQFWGA